MTKHAPYHDDVMIPMSGAPEQIVDSTYSIALIVYTFLNIYGLTLNIGKN